MAALQDTSCGLIRLRLRQGRGRRAPCAEQSSHPASVPARAAGPIKSSHPPSPPPTPSLDTHLDAPLDVQKFPLREMHIDVAIREMQRLLLFNAVIALVTA